MKKLAGIFAFSALAMFAIPASGQEKNTVGQDLKNAGKDVGKAGKKVGHKTAEISSKGASKIVDKTYRDKTGPTGQTIYIDKHSKYYYVDEKGHHVYVHKSELIDK